MTTKRAVDVPRLLRDLKLSPRRAGSELRGDCPSRKHPKRPGPGSWQIVPDGPKAGSHKCYGCGFGGGPLDLAAEVLGLDRRAAREWLATRHGLEVATGGRPDDWSGKAAEPPSLWYPEGTISIFTAAGSIRTIAQPAVKWLRARGVTDDESRAAAFGVVPETAPKYRGRIIVPIVVRGALVDFVARLYQPAAATIPKALSGRRDEGAMKELALWGYDDLRPEIDRVFVTEGVWGALAMRRAGFSNVVAACGSAWSQERTELLAAWPTIVIVPDGDPAGAKLESRAASLRIRSRLLVVDLPPGGQPDEIAAEDLRRLVAAARASGPGRRVPEPGLAEWSGKG